MLSPGRCCAARSGVAGAVGAANAPDALAARTGWLLVCASKEPQRKTAKAIGVFAVGCGCGGGCSGEGGSASAVESFVASAGFAADGGAP
jgi:hypothetical protein